MDMRKPFTWHFLMCNNSYSNQSQLQSSRTKRYSDSRQKWKQRMNPHLFPVLARLPTTGHADRESEEESRLHLPVGSRWWMRYKAQTRLHLPEDWSRLQVVQRLSRLLAERWREVDDRLDQPDTAHLGVCVQAGRPVEDQLLLLFPLSRSPAWVEEEQLGQLGPRHDHRAYRRTPSLSCLLYTLISWLGCRWSWRRRLWKLVIF